MALTDELCRSFLDLWWHFDPAAATLAGIPGHDGRLGAFGSTAVREHAAALRAIAAAVEELDVETTADEIDRTALLDHLRVLLFRFEHEHPYQRNPALWLEHLAAALEGLLLTRAEPVDPADGAERVKAIAGLVREARATLRQPPRFLVDCAIAQLAALEPLLDEVADRLVLDGALATEARRALAELGSALAALPADPDPHATAIGEDEVDRRLHHEHASIHNAAEVWRAALRLAEETEAEVAAAAALVEPGRPWQEVYRLQLDDAVVWGQLEGEFQAALDASAAFAGAQGLAAELPSLDVMPFSAAAALLEPIAGYRPVGATGRAALLVGDPPRPAIPWLAVRLGVPGLHLHRTERDALEGTVRRHIAAASTPLGWSLYAQHLLAELGYEDTPESRLNERVLFLLDVQRAVADIGLHTRQFTPEEAVEHLIARTPLDRAAALAEVRKIACRPTLACAAILGWQELGRLRQDVQAARGAAFRLEGFHRELFSYGGLPVPLIRWGMGLDG